MNVNYAKFQKKMVVEQFQGDCVFLRSRRHVGGKLAGMEGGRYA